jgi:hypothetical protein
MSYYEEDKVLLVGKEVYENTNDQGKVPISNMTANGSVFSELFDPLNLIDKNLTGNIFNQEIFAVWDEWKNLDVFDKKESISNSPDPTGIKGFSDESMIRALINIRNFSNKVKKIERSVDVRNNWIDRSWWDVNHTKLNNGEYVICNFLRPFKENYHICKPIVDFIYGKNMAEYPFIT